MESQFLHEKRAGKRIIILDGAQVMIDNESWLNFASHDYLGLSHHSELKKSAMRHLLHDGVGMSTSQLSYGYFQSQYDLEVRLAELSGKEAATLFSSRRYAHVLILNLLARHHPLILLPKNHSSYFAAELSGAKIQCYDENFDEIVDQYRDIPKIVITSHFNLKMGTLSEEDIVLIDATEIFGIQDFPPTSAHLIMSGFENAAGCQGAFLASTQEFKDRLGCDEASLAPSNIGTIDTALDVFGQMEGERRQLEQRGFWLKKQMKEMGFSLVNSPSHIVTIRYDEVSLLEERLSLEHILAHFEKDRVTFILTAHHSLEHLHHLVEVLKFSASSLAFSTQSATETP